MSKWQKSLMLSTSFLLQKVWRFYEIKTYFKVIFKTKLNKNIKLTPKTILKCVPNKEVNDLTEWFGEKNVPLDTVIWET